MISAGKSNKRAFKMLKGILILFALTAITLVILTSVVTENGTNIDAVFRFFTYIGFDMDDDGQFEIIKFDSHITNIYGRFGNSLAVLSSTDFRVFNSYGKEVLNRQMFLENPALAASEKYAAVFDRGGNYILVANAHGKAVFEKELDGAIVRADMNDHGYMALIMRQGGSNSRVLVYSPDMKEIYGWHASSRYIVSASVSEDGKMLAVGCIGQDGTRFTSSVVTFMLDSEDTYAEHTINDSLLLSVSFMDENKICAVTEDKLVFIEPDIAATNEFSYKGMYLGGYEVNRSYAMTLLNRFRTDGRAEAVLAAPDGTETHREKQSGDVLSFSATEKYIAILYPEKLIIYTDDFKHYSETPETHGASGVFMRNDGSAILLNSNSAKLFIP